MAVIPSLGEINAYQPNADLGGGSPSVVIDNRETVRLLNDAANQKAQNDWNKYLVFQNNLKDVYKNLGDISSIETATTDKDYLSKQAAEVYKEIGENPKDFFSGGGKYNEIQAKIAKLRSEATESKLNQVYDFAHKQYLTQNPELNTPENQNKINEYLNTPLGQRKGYILDMPSLFNAQDYFGALLNNPLVKSDFAESGLEDNDKFIRDIAGTKYKRDAFLNLAKIGFDTQVDKYGHSIQKAITERYNQLPEFYKADYEKRGGVKTFFNEMAEHYFGSDKDIVYITKNDLNPNTNAYKAQELALKAQDVKQGWARIGLEQQRLNKLDNEDIVGANSVLNEAVSILNKGVPININQTKGGKTSTQKLVEIADPTLLQTFGNVDKDGKTTNVPDAVQYDKGKGELYLVYYKKVIDEYGAFTGEIAKGTDGGKIVVDRKPLDERTWLKTIAKRSFPNKDIGSVNGLVDEVVTKAGNSLYNVAKIYSGNNETGGETSKAITLTGNENPSDLKVDQIYILDGQQLKWNGKNLVKQK